LLPHLRAVAPSRRYDQADERRHETRRANTEPLSKLPHPNAQGGDPLALRGLPMIGPAGSVMSGTQPEQALLAKERRRR
jgi:hypothetical protein